MSHKAGSAVKSIIKVPFSHYKIEADPVSESEDESPAKKAKEKEDIEIVPEAVP